MPAYLKVMEYDEQLQEMYDDICQIPVYGPINVDLFGKLLDDVKHWLHEFNGVIFAIDYFGEGHVNLHDINLTSGIWAKGFIAATNLDILLADVYWMNKHEQLEDRTRFARFWLNVTGPEIRHLEG